VVLASGASAGDVCDIISYTAFEIADQTFTGTTTLDGAVVINESSADVDFRVESNGNANMLFVDGGNNRVGIGTALPQQLLHLSATNPGGKIRLEMSQTGVANNDVTGEIQFYHNDASGAGVNADIKGICTNNIGAGALTFGTGTTSATERMRIGSTGIIYVNGDGTGGRISGDGSGGLNLQDGNGRQTFKIMSPASGSTQPLTLDASGNVLVGTSSARTVQGFVHKVQVEGTTAGTSSISIVRNTNSVDPPYVSFGKTRSGSVGASGVVQQNDILGRIDFTGANGSNLNSLGARIDARVDGTPGGSDMPTRLTFQTSADGSANPTQRMVIDSSGKVIIGTEPDNTYSQGWSSIGGVQDSSRDSTALRLHYAFRNPNGSVGTIQTNGSSTSYNTSSDYRLKTDAQPMTGASARVQALKPVNFEWIVDGTRVDGFLAHEAQEVVPEAVTGTKDGMMDEEYQVSAATGDIYTPATDAYVDADGNDVDAVDEVIHSADVEQPETLADGQQWRETTAAVTGTRSVPDMQGIDQSKMVPLLVAALQEALARITALENA